uniref:Uncharacterized protein n=1 Tax=Ciona intestinalis TaxID=7719 RepID=H2Y0Z6_CIOIN
VSNPDVFLHDCANNIHHDFIFSLHSNDAFFARNSVNSTVTLLTVTAIVMGELLSTPFSRCRLLFTGESPCFSQKSSSLCDKLGDNGTA